MKLKLLFLVCIGILNVQAQTAKKVVLKTNAAANKTDVKTPVLDGIFVTFTTTKGDITAQLEYEKTPVTVANFIALAEGKNTFVTDDKLKAKPFFDGLK
ncbi:MAG: peptidylprolyl isomerase, partial [Flavobacterium sp.]